MLAALTLIILGACSAGSKSAATDTKTRVGIVLTEVGLGTARSMMLLLTDWSRPGTRKALFLTIANQARIRLLKQRLRNFPKKSSILLLV